MNFKSPSSDEIKNEIKRVSKLFIQRNEVEAIRVRPGEAMTSVIYTTRPDGPSSNITRQTVKQC